MSLPLNVLSVWFNVQIFTPSFLSNLQLVLKICDMFIPERSEKEMVGVRMHVGQNTDNFKSNTDDKWIKTEKGEEEATDA